MAPYLGRLCEGRCFKMWETSNLLLRTNVVGLKLGGLMLNDVERLCIVEVTLR